MSKPLHVLFVASWFPTREDPYPGDFIQRHAQAASHLHRVTTLHVHGVKNLNHMEVTDTAAGKNYREIIVYFPKSRWKALNIWRKYKAYQHGNRSIDPYQIIHGNVLHYNLLWAYFQSFRQRIPLVVSEHWTGYYSSLSRLRKWFCLILARRCSYLLPVSKSLKKAMQNHGLKSNYKVIPNVIDTRKFTPAKSARKKMRFLHLSMLREAHKNISGQLQAARDLVQEGYDFEFHIGGNGDLLPIKKYINQYGLESHIKTFGALTHDEVVSKMQNSDCFILFSHYETQGVVLIESLACGVPFIASDLEAIREYYRPEYGLLVEPGNTESLKSAMRSMLDARINLASRSEMHKAVHEIFSVEQISKAFDTIYRHALKDRK